MSPRGDRLQRELPAEDTDSPASLMVAYKPQNDAEFSSTHARSHVTPTLHQSFLKVREKIGVNWE